MRGIYGWVVVVALAHCSISCAQDLAKDDNVVIAEEAAFHLKDVTTEIPVGTVVKVLRVAGNRVWVSWGHRSGWLERRAVILLDRLVAELSKKIQDNPAEAKYFLMRAYLWGSAGNSEKAISDYGRALAMRSDNAEIFLGRAREWQAMGDVDKAIADLSTAIRLDSRCADAYVDRGYGWHAKGEFNKAIADFDEALRLRPTDADAYRLRGAAWESKGEHRKAIANLSEALRHHPEDADALARRGRQWAMVGEPERAVADYSHALQIDPQNAITYFNRANQWVLLGKLEKAIVDFDQAIVLDPQYAMSYTIRATTFIHRGEYQRAVADFGEAIRIDPNCMIAYRNRALLRAACPDANFRDGKQAIEDATRACELTEWKDHVTLDTLAAAFAESQNFDAAIRCETRAMELAPDAKRAAYVQRRRSYFDGRPLRWAPDDQSVSSSVPLSVDRGPVQKR